MNEIHPHDEEELHGTLHGLGVYSQYLPEFVYGGIDGIVTTFAVVAGATGANLDISIVLILWFANLLADGFSMSVGSYLSKKSEQATYEKHKKIEEREIDQRPEIEKQEVRDIYAKKWFEGALLEQVVETLTADKSRRVEVMMKEEHGMNAFEWSAFMNGLATFTAFVVVWLLPLIAYILYYMNIISEAWLFETAIVVTALAFIGIGRLKSYVTKSPLPKSIAETLLLWLLAAFVAYYVGDVLEQIIRA